MTENAPLSNAMQLQNAIANYVASTPQIRTVLYDSKNLTQTWKVNNDMGKVRIDIHPISHEYNPGYVRVVVQLTRISKQSGVGLSSVEFTMSSLTGETPTYVRRDPPNRHLKFWLEWLANQTSPQGQEHV